MVRRLVLAWSESRRPNPAATVSALSLQEVGESWASSSDEEDEDADMLEESSGAEQERKSLQGDSQQSQPLDIWWTDREKK